MMKEVRYYNNYRVLSSCSSWQAHNGGMCLYRCAVARRYLSIVIKKSLSGRGEASM